MAKVLQELNKELMGKAIVKFVDYWKYGYLASQFEFEVIPTQFFYDKNGNLYKTHQGEISKSEALNIFKEMGYDF
ncbi:MAG: thioredoxin family protein [Mollicutes bacterium]|nr:thioredoxin family protein [Mollicutes bacterium]